MGEMKISRFTDSTEISYKKNTHNFTLFSITWSFLPDVLNQQYHQYYMSGKVKKVEIFEK